MAEEEEEKRESDTGQERSRKRRRGRWRRRGEGQGGVHGSRCAGLSRPSSPVQCSRGCGGRVHEQEWRSGYRQQAKLVKTKMCCCQVAHVLLLGTY